MRFKSDFLAEAHWRGLIHQGTDLEGLDALMAGKKITAYIGFDATAKSLHVGNLIPIMWLRLLQKHGHTPLIVMGDGTTLIGDPSGKDDVRQLLSLDTIQENIASIQEIFEHYLSLGSNPGQAKIIRNSQWLLDLKYVDFLRDYGRHFSVNRMLTFDSVKLRLDREQNLSFLEFNYMIFQAYDFLVLNRQNDCVLQLGGSDQWGNIVNGVDLIRRCDGKDSYGLTNPLIATASGAKMGKTAQGAVWLRGDHLSPYDYWQFWRNTDDKDVGRFLRLFTDLSLKEIEALEALQGSEINEAKKVLADEATRLCHGADALAEARSTAEKIFESNQIQDASALPQMAVTQAELAPGKPVVDILTTLGFAESKGDARRMIRGGGARLNDQVITNEAGVISMADFKGTDTLKISAGKKRHGLLILRD